MKYPLISIILPVFNGERFLKQSIQSCLGQTYLNLELIIVNDASTDSTLQIAEYFASVDNRVHIITNNINQKLPASLNIGHREARGKFITWTSDDNIYQKDALNKLYQTMIEQHADIVYSDYLIINEDGVLVRESRLKDLEYLLLYGVIGTCFLYKKEVYSRNNGYNEDLFLVEDYDFWLRALKHSSYYRLKNPGYYFYRYHSNSLTGRIAMDPVLKEKCKNNLIRLYSDLFNDCKIKDKDSLIAILIHRGIEGPHTDIMVLNSKNFFEDLRVISSSFLGFSFKKIKRIFLNDAIETILKNRKFQKISVLVALHRYGKAELMCLPINRYLAILKKCFF